MKQWHGDMFEVNYILKNIFLYVNMMVGRMDGNKIVKETKSIFLLLNLIIEM